MELMLDRNIIKLKNIIKLFNFCIIWKVRLSDLQKAFSSMQPSIVSQKIRSNKY